MTKFRASVLTIAVSTVICGLASLAGALPANEVETTYYEDATFTTEVGYSILGCNGGHARSGKTSRYIARFSTPCRTSGPTEVACVVDGVPTMCSPSICDSGLFSCN
jgi:uncharacterized protein DUF6289